MSSVWNSLEICKLVASASTPVALVAVGWWIKKREQINGGLVSKRIAIYDDVVPLANDIYCFFLGVGHWAELDPSAVIQRKRKIDQTMHRYKFFWSDACSQHYVSFMKTCFAEFQGAGAPAKLRLDVSFLQSQLGPKWKEEWTAFVAVSRPPSSSEVRTAYDAWIRCLAIEVGAAPKLSARRPRSFRLAAPWRRG